MTHDDETSDCDDHNWIEHITFGAPTVLVCTKCGLRRAIVAGNQPGHNCQQPNLVIVPKVLLIASDRGVCVGGRWDGWMMVKHPNGQWVSHHKLDAVSPITEMSDLLRAIETGGGPLIPLSPMGDKPIIARDAESAPEISALIEGWGKLICEAEMQMSDDADCGERIDLRDYGVCVDVDTAKATLTALRAIRGDA